MEWVQIKCPFGKNTERKREVKKKKKNRRVLLIRVRYYISSAYIVPLFHGNLRISNTEHNN